jgi:hypothetical protein
MDTQFVKRYHFKDLFEGKHMNKKKAFTPEEQRILAENPNTYHVTRTMLSLTLEAKKRILEMTEKNYPYAKIMKELGYNLDIIGMSRAHGLVWHVKKEAQSELGLHEGYVRTKGKRLSDEDIKGLPTNPESFGKLINELSYLRQEVEFLKKISQVKNTKKRDESL